MDAIRSSNTPAPIRMTIRRCFGVARITAMGASDGITLPVTRFVLQVTQITSLDRTMAPQFGQVSLVSFVFCWSGDDFCGKGLPQWTQFPSWGSVTIPHAGQFIMLATAKY